MNVCGMQSDTVCSWFSPRPEGSQHCAWGWFYKLQLVICWAFLWQTANTAAESCWLFFQVFGLWPNCWRWLEHCRTLSTTMPISARCGFLFHSESAVSLRRAIDTQPFANQLKVNNLGVVQGVLGVFVSFLVDSFVTTCSLDLTSFVFNWMFLRPEGIIKLSFLLVFERLLACFIASSCLDETSLNDGEEMVGEKVKERVSKEEESWKEETPCMCFIFLCIRQQHVWCWLLRRCMKWFDAFYSKAMETGAKEKAAGNVQQRQPLWADDCPRRGWTVDIWSCPEEVVELISMQA